MKCPECRNDTPSDAEFCPECGAKLTVVCVHCEAINAPQHKFCKKCGQQLIGVNEPTEVRAVSGERVAPEAERRQLTVMFADLVDSTALAERLDPEELRDVVRDYQATSAEVISRFEGHIAQYLGDGLLVYFGYPQAHEDDAQRAVHTGLGIVEAVGRLSDHLQDEKGIELAVRLGIHTGPVVVGEMGTGTRHEQLAMGEAPNVAARLQGLADPDTVVVTAATKRLLHGAFVLGDPGHHSVKGVSTPVEAYRVVGETSAESRLELGGTGGLTPLVGREPEVGLLRQQWEQAKEGRGQVVIVVGEAGVGKSRLVVTIKEHVREEAHTRWECRCSPYHQQSALYPVIDLFQRALRFSRETSPEDRLRTIERELTRFGLPLDQTVPLFASLLSVPLAGRYPALTLGLQRQREKTLEAVVELLLSAAAEQPVLMIVEDLHWVDPSTLELLTLLQERIPTAEVLLLLTFRPDFRPVWPERAHFTHVTVSRFTGRQTELMVERIAGGKALPREVLQQVVEKTDGIPLFVEELTKMVLESGLVLEANGRYELSGPLPPLAIPDTLQDSLMARLDRLATAKEVAQLGATLGRTFSYDLLRAVSSRDELPLQRELKILVDAELLYQQDMLPRATYVFKHALIQEAAYESLLKSTRQQYHHRIAQVLEEKFPEIVETQPELLAHHYTEAGLIERAIPYWLAAGKRAIQRSANVEAISHLRKGLDLLQSLPDSPERIENELELLVASGVPLMATKGYTAPEVLEAHTRARELCRRAGDTPKLFQVLYGLFGFYVIRPEIETAREVAEQFLHATQRQGASDHGLVAHRVLGTSLLFQGDLAGARGHFETVTNAYDPPKHRAHCALYGRDTGVDAHAMLSLTLWLMGYSDQAKRRHEESLALARELEHPFSLAIAYFVGAVLHSLLRDARLSRESAEDAIVLSTQQGFPNWLALSTILRGWAVATQGSADEGIGQVEKVLEALATMGAGVMRPYSLALLAGAYGKVGKADEGLFLVTEALTVSEKTGERWCDAELYRIKGELLLQKRESEASKAEGCYLQAIHTAQQQGAKSLELRASTGLARLWQRQGKNAKAHQILADVYGWFSEGFDTPDLQEAKALLGALAAATRAESTR